MPAPANDNFANATVLSGLWGRLIGESNVGATLETGEPAANFNGSSDTQTIWYKWTAPAAGTVQLDTLGSGTGPFGMDSVIDVWTGSAVNALTAVTANDDHGGGFTDPAGWSGTSALTMSVTAGTVYYLRVYGYSTSQANSNIIVNWRYTSGSTVPATFVAASAGTATIVLPAGIQGGDLIALFFANQTSGVYTVAPAGFNLDTADGVGTFNRMACWKVAAGVYGAASADAGATVTASVASVSAAGVWRNTDVSPAPGTGGRTGPTGGLASGTSMSTSSINSTIQAGIMLFVTLNTTAGISQVVTGNIGTITNPLGYQTGQGANIDSFAGRHETSYGAAYDTFTYTSGSPPLTESTIAWFLPDGQSTTARGGWSVGSVRIA